MTRARRIWLVVAVLALAGGLIPFHHKGTSGTSEFPVYTLAGERMAAGEEIYRVSDPKAFTYPPFFALPFVLMPGVPMDPPRPALPIVIWYLINAGALVWIVRIVHRRAVPRDSTPARVAWFWGLTLALSARHIAAVFGNQSHDLFVLLPIVLGIDAWCRARDARAGAWVGIAAACKATPLLFAVPFVVQRRVLGLAGLALGGAAVTLLPDVLYPREDKLWVMAWIDTFVSGVRPGEAAGSGPWTAGAFLNQGLSGTLHRLFTPAPDTTNPYVLDVALFDAGDTGRKVIGALAALTVVGLIAAVSRPAVTRGLDGDDLANRRFGQAGAVLCGMVLLSPMSSKSHFCVLLIPMAFCVHHFLRCRGPVLGALLIAVFAVGTLTTKGVVGRELGNWLLAYGAVTWGAALSLVATAWVLHRTTPAAAE